MSSTGAFDFTLRYQHTPFAKYHARPLSLLQQDILYRCDGTVTIADLADATLCTLAEIRAALSFLIQHGLVKTLMPETWLFTPPHYQRPVVASRPPLAPGHIQRWLHLLKRRLRDWHDRLSFGRLSEGKLPEKRGNSLYTSLRKQGYNHS